jgi:hypothetical protein
MTIVLETVFVCAAGSCDGNEEQIFAGESCENFSSLKSVKVFCHEASRDSQKNV